MKPVHAGVKNLIPKDGNTTNLVLELIKGKITQEQFEKSLEALMNPKAGKKNNS